MKSAYELAMERLEKKSPTQHLTEEQKAQIAEIESTYKARIAERELFLREQLDRAAGESQTDQVELLQKQLASEVRRLNEDCEAKKEKVRREKE